MVSATITFPDEFIGFLPMAASKRAATRRLLARLGSNVNANLVRIPCCIAKDKMLLCKQMGCCWYLVYISSALETDPAMRWIATRGHHVQDCCYRPRALRHLIRPPDGHDRSPADGERPDLHPQRRPSLFRPL